jgi:hypothetical protein
MTAVMNSLPRRIAVARRRQPVVASSLVRRRRIIRLISNVHVETTATI